MKSLRGLGIFVVTFLFANILTGNAAAPDRVKTANGVIEGAGRQSSGVRMFKGIPYAQPPVGDLRWKAPQSVKNWPDVRPAVQFGPQCMQHRVFSDMNFRSNGVSEDCLYLNVWTPAAKNNERLPVLVYFYGGGFVAGDGSEFRYDGESMAAKGIVVVTLNYRLGVYGFLAHPELTKESPHHASGNYGLLDQSAAIAWVSRNIAAFGGDPKKITIGGESAGSISVSAQMASPLSKNLIHGAIGESGSALAKTSTVPLDQAEQNGEKFAAGLKATSLTELRALSTEQLQEATKNRQWRFPLTVDGYFLPEPPAAIYAAGKQARVPLLVGWNSEESSWRAVLGNEEPTPENYEKAVRKLDAARADELLKLYPATTRDDVFQTATALAGDRFIGFATWKWFDMHTKTGGKPVYRYFYAQPRPATNPEPGKTAAPAARGAAHSAEIEYLFGNLATNKVYAWTPDDYRVSKMMQELFANFIKKGDPNAPDLPNWPAVLNGQPVYIMHLAGDSRSVPDKTRERYVFFDKF